jgi:hypothetical protein
MSVVAGKRGNEEDRGDIIETVDPFPALKISNEQKLLIFRRLDKPRFFALRHRSTLTNKYIIIDFAIFYWIWNH